MAERRSIDDDKAAHQRARIDALIDRARAIHGGPMVTSEMSDCPPDIAEQFWRNVVAFESAEEAPLFDQLVQRGVALPAPDEVADGEMHDVLWKVIAALAEMRTYLDCTDHLSDRALYEMLWNDSLRVPEPVFEPESTWNCHIDLSGAGGGPEESIIYLKYYADDEARDAWADESPGEPLPDHEDPPYDRDRLLPGPRFR